MSNNNSRPSPHLLRLALGLIFFHFGFLKFFPDLSPAEMIASQTVMRLTGGSFDAPTAKPIPIEHSQPGVQENVVACVARIVSVLQDCAQEMEVSVSTVSTYRARILEKLNLSNTAALIRYAVENSVSE
jgi:DNA-binding CsgD family transcriptional regulator